MSKALLQKVIEIASAEIGVREVGENSGRRVREFQAATTLGGTNWPWCSAYTSWVIREACKAMKVKNPFIASASCDIVLAWARKLHIIHDTPQPGDVFLVMASKYDATHTGLVTAVSGAVFTCIEGNTNDNGGREGIGVFKHKRTNGDKYLFVRWMDLCEFEDETTQVKVNGKTLGSRRIDGAWRVSARMFGEAIGWKVHWNGENQTLVFNGREFPKQTRLIDGSQYAGVNDLAQFANMAVSFDKAAGIITVGK